jgi:hypothetical protein
MTCNTGPRIVQLPIKGTLESVTLGFDFSDDFATVQTIVSIIVTGESAAGTPDPNPAAILVGSASVDSVNAAQVNQRVEGGLDSTQYAVQCTATGDNGDTQTIVSLLPVRQLNS